MRAIWRDYGLSITLASLFLASLALQTWTGWWEYVAKQRHDGLPAEAFGPDGYVWSWATGDLRELAVRVPPGLRLHPPDDLPHPSPEP